MLEALTAGPVRLSPLLELQSLADLAHSCPRRQGLSQLLLALMFLHNDYFPARQASFKMARVVVLFIWSWNAQQTGGLFRAPVSENLLDDRPQKHGEREGSDTPLEISLPSFSSISLAQSCPPATPCLASANLCTSSYLVIWRTRCHTIPFKCQKTISIKRPTIPSTSMTCWTLGL